jgi:hypothetical protein
MVIGLIFLFGCEKKETKVASDNVIVSRNETTNKLYKTVLYTDDEGLYETEVKYCIQTYHENEQIEHKMLKQAKILIDCNCGNLLIAENPLEDMAMSLDYECSGCGKHYFFTMKGWRLEMIKQGEQND